MIVCGKNALSETRFSASDRDRAYYSLTFSWNGPSLFFPHLLSATRPFEQLNIVTISGETVQRTLVLNVRDEKFGSKSERSSVSRMASRCTGIMLPNEISDV